MSLFRKKIDSDKFFRKDDFDIIIKNKYNIDNIIDYPSFEINENKYWGISTTVFNSYLITSVDGFDFGIYLNKVQSYPCSGISNRIRIICPVNVYRKSNILDFSFFFRSEYNKEDIKKSNILSVVIFLLKKYIKDNDIDYVLFGKNTKLKKYYKNIYNELLGDDFKPYMIKENDHYYNDMVIYVKKELLHDKILSREESIFC